MKKSNKIIRVGVIGIGRGMGFASAANAYIGMQLVALCDTQEKKLHSLGKRLKVSTYTDYEKFLEHDMDAVVVANYFHEHALFAIKALRAGKHVMSETSACLTLAQGVQLIREVEKSKKIYMFAENYPYMAYNQEMRRVFKAGRIGEFMYGEGEYVHPGSADFINKISCGLNHWRNWIPATYYCTHSLAPIMFITDTWPTKVNGFIVLRSKDDPVTVRTVLRHDTASMITLRMDNGAVVKLLQWGLRGESIWTRIHGSRGQMENLRHGDNRMLRIRREQYHEKRTSPAETIYLPDFPEHHEKAVEAEHGGGDFFMDYHFAQAIRRNEQPYFDVYRGVAMSSVGILAYRSALQNSNTVDVPDFRRESTLRKFTKDDWSPDPVQHKSGQPWPSILGDVKPSAKGIEYARKIWKKAGFEVNE
ncbi:MAG: Gfo/Idh/MocA family protein [Sedimentisphaerales bacterium]